MVNSCGPFLSINDMFYSQCSFNLTVFVGFFFPLKECGGYKDRARKEGGPAEEAGNEES